MRNPGRILVSSGACLLFISIALLSKDPVYYTKSSGKYALVRGLAHLHYEREQHIIGFSGEKDSGEEHFPNTMIFLGDPILPIFSGPVVVCGIPVVHSERKYLGVGLSKGLQKPFIIFSFFHVVAITILWGFVRLLMKWAKKSGT